MKTRLNVTVELDQDDINDALLLKELLKANNSLKEECIASDEVLKASCRHKFFKAELLLFPFVSEGAQLRETEKQDVKRMHGYLFIC